ncbi:MAG: neutral zinc metallopeptidase [Acidimicrobiales bacterium]
MDFDESDQANTGQIEDRRGAGGGLRGGPIAVGAGGLGVVGLVITLLLSFLGKGAGGVPGFDPSSISNIDATGAASTPASEIGTSCKGVTSTTDNAQFISCVNTNIQNFWTTTFTESGQQYTETKLVLFTQGTQSGCGQASSETGPFYCPLDQKVYLDLDFFKVLASSLGGPNTDFAQAYVLAHEIGHHLQTVLGTESQVRDAQQRNPSQRNSLSVRLELQADCFAGVWGNSAFKTQKVEEAEIDDALDAAASVGDDRIQKSTTGRVNPESFTHGTSEQRKSWFRKGFDTGDPNACDSFSGGI